MEASGTPVTSSPVITGGARPRTTPTQEDAQFKQKLRHMGKCREFILLLVTYVVSILNNVQSFFIIQFFYSI